MHRDKRIARAVLQGYSNAAIARQHGLSRQRVVQIRQDMGLPAARVMPATRERYRRNPVLVERDDTIIRMYQDDAPIAQIMRDLGVTRAVVGNVISKAGVAQDRHMRRNARNQRIVDRYLEGVPLKELATEFGITLGLVGNVLSTAGVTNRRAPQIRHRDPTIAARNKLIVARYQEGVPCKDLAAEFGITLGQVYTVIRADGVALCRHKDPKIAARNQQIVALYLDGALEAQIMRKLAVTRAVVSTVISVAGVAQGRSLRRNPEVAARNQRIVARYQEGNPPKDLATEFGVSISLINTVIRAAGVTKNQRRPRDPQITARDQRIVARYQDGVPRKDLATEFGITRTLVSTVISRAGVAQNQRSPGDPEIAARDKQIVARYQDGVPNKDLAAEFGITRTLVNTVISNAGVVQDRHKQRDPKIAARNQRIVARYQEGVPYQELATEFGISFSLVNFVIRTAGVANRNRRVHHRTGVTP